MSKPIEVTDETFNQEVLQAQGPVLVDFWAPWCGPCRMMAPVLEKMVDKFQGKLKIAKLNTDENPSTAGNYQITGIPSLLVFKNGEEVQRIVGFHPEQEMTRILEALA
jgi:thioredoxin 1